MPPPLRFLVAPLTAGLTDRRFVHVLLGAVLLLPYLALSVQTVQTGGIGPLGLVLLVVPATAVFVGVGLVPGVHALRNPLGTGAGSRTGGGRGLAGMRASWGPDRARDGGAWPRGSRSAESR